MLKKIVTKNENKEKCSACGMSPYRAQPEFKDELIPVSRHIITPNGRLDVYPSPNGYKLKGKMGVD